MNFSNYEKKIIINLRKNSNLNLTQILKIIKPEEDPSDKIFCMMLEIFENESQYNFEYVRDNSAVERFMQLKNKGKKTNDILIQMLVERIQY